MKHKLIATASLFVLFLSPAAVAQGNGHAYGHDKDKDHDKGRGHEMRKEERHEERREVRGQRYVEHAPPAHVMHGDRFYSDRDYREARVWYDGHRGHLPPGLAKRDRLPPGLERHLVRRGVIPPEYRTRIVMCPPELVRVLPPPPPQCSHVFIEGRLVLLNRNTNVIVDIFNF